MYTIVPVNLLATRYDVFYKEEHIATIVQPAVSIKDKFSVIMKRQEYCLSRQGVVSGDWKFELDNSVIATASKPNFLKDEFIVWFDSHRLILKSKFMSLKNQFLIYEESLVIGCIAQAGLFSRKMQCTIRDDVPHVLVVFLICLVLIAIDRRSGWSHN